MRSQRLRGGHSLSSRGVATALAMGVASFGVLFAAGATAGGSDCTVTPILVNTCRPWLGAWANNYPQAANNVQAQTLYHEQRIGRPLDIVHTYHAIGVNQLTPTDVYFATRPNTLLLANWKPAPTWAAITSQDAGIDQMATSIKALAPHKIFLTLWHEPEDDVSPGGDPNCPGITYRGSMGTVADYRAMWQYVESRFAADGVSNVVWVMDYMSYYAWDCLVPDLWPGNNLVDWVMFDPYSDGATSTFDSVVSRFTAVLTADTDNDHNFLGKPWGIGEWGAYSLTTAQEEAWVDEAKAAVDANTYPGIDAYVVFDAAPSRVGYDDNGTLDSAKATHYTAFADDAAFSGSWTDPNAPPTSTPSPTDSPTGTPTTDPPTSDPTTDPPTSDPTTDPTTDPPSPPSSPTPDPDTTPPTAPTALAGQAAGPTEVDLTWSAAQDAGGVTGYDVSRNGTVIATLPATTTYQDMTATDASAESYTVDAFDAAGNVSPASDPVTVTTPDGTPPSAPPSFQATATAPHQVQLSWQTASDNVAVTGYDLYRNSSLLVSLGPATSYTDTVPTDAATYAYSIQARDAAGNVGAPNTASATTPDSTPPSAPTGLHATPAYNQVSLTWAAATDNVGVTAYGVYRNATLIATLTAPAVSYVDTLVTPRTTYSYTVRAVDAAGNVGPLSTTVSTTTPAPPDTTPPTVPTGLTGKVNTSKTVTLTWKASTDNVGVKGYTVLRNGVQLATTSTLTYTDSTAKQGSSYQYAVSAYDAAGNQSAKTAAVTVAVPDTTAPSTPTNFKLTPGSKSITLSWTASTDNVAVTGYYVYRGNTRLPLVTLTTYTDKSLNPSTTYSYRVVARDAAGNLSPATATLKARPTP